jgi:ribose-phosphate pyrophosphokinase
VVVVSPDLGRVKAARRFARMLDASFAIVTKERPTHELAVAAEVIGEVRGKHAVVGDDMIVSGGTLAAAVVALLEAGAQDVRAFATHALFTPGAAETLGESGLDELVVTDTVALPGSLEPAGTRIVSVAGLLADTIRAVFQNTSVSALFAGENELF